MESEEKGCRVASIMIPGIGEEKGGTTSRLPVGLEEGNFVNEVFWSETLLALLILLKVLTV